MEALRYLAENDPTSSVSVPAWIFYGLGLAVVMTVVLVLLAKFFISGGWIGDGDTYKHPGFFIPGFVLSLAASLVTTGLWVHGHYLLAVPAGIVAFVVAFFVLNALLKLKRS